jgi:hypothetical protein
MTKKIAKVEVLSGKINAIEFVAKEGYPEVGRFADQKTLQKFYKQLDTSVLEDWCTIEGLEYKPCLDSEPINRMRLAMAILYKHFPKEKSTSTPKKSKYADYTTESLISMAIEHDVPVEVTEDMRIMRMRCIMALRASKVIE